MHNTSLDTFANPSPDWPHVVSFSGGRTSGRMLKELLDSGIKPVVLFANTGKERDETLDFVHEVETQWKLEVVWLEYCRVPTTAENLAWLKTARMRSNAAKSNVMHWFKRVDYKTAARHSDAHTPFDELLEWMTVLPNPRSRACTAQLKIRTMQRYLWSQGIQKCVNHIGFRADELDRVADLVWDKNRDYDVAYRFLLAENGVTETEVRQWWTQQPFDLQLQSYEGNCHLCFLKKRSAKQRLIIEQPQFTQWWKFWEEKKKTCGEAGSRWRTEKGHAIEELENDAAAKAAIEDGDSGMDCQCTAGVTVGTNYEASED